MTTLILAIVLLILSGVLVAAEIAFLATGQRRARQWAEEGSRGGQLLWNLMKDPSQLRSTMLVTVTVVLYTAGVLAMYGARGQGWTWGVPLVVVLIAGFVCAALLPILYALQRPEHIARLSAPLVRGAHWVLYPLAVLVNRLTHTCSRLLGGADHREPVTEEEILTAIDVAGEQGVIAEDEKEMLHGVIEFGDKTVRDVMVPRVDMVSLEASATVRDALQRLMQKRHSRLPVFQGDADHIVGIVYLKDLLPFVRQGQMDLAVEKVLRPAYLIPESKKVSTLLAEFQHHRRLMAIVVGEHGEAVGLVTIEDLLEEIVGDILDEYDVEEKPMELIAEDTWLVEASLSVREVNRRLRVRLPENGFGTLAGLIIHRLGGVPMTGDTLTVENVEITVEQMDGTRVKRVRMTKRG